MVKDELDKVFSKYKKVTNMTFTELLVWSKSECSRKASLNRKPINRNLRLLSKPKSQWTTNDIKNANKTISFIARMKKVKKGKEVCKGMSKRDISLMNWAFNPFK